MQSCFAHAKSRCSAPAPPLKWAPHQQTGAPPLLSRSNLFSLAAALVIIGAAIYFALYVPRSEGVTTIYFGTQSLTWNDVRRVCTGTPNGTTVHVSPTLSIKCVR